MMSRVIEAGHYYAAHGPTHLSAYGWTVLSQIRSGKDESMLFIDDVHPVTDVWHEERSLPPIDFTPEADHQVLESEVAPEALEFLELLKALPRRHRATRQDGKPWYCSGTQLTNGRGQPLCVLLDAGLTLRKYRLGFRDGTNILPWYYEQEQSYLRKLVRKVLPDFQLRVVLFEANGELREI